MRNRTRHLLVAVATVTVFGLTLLPARALPSVTAATTLQFYGGEARAVAQIGNTIYVGGASPQSGTGRARSRAYLAALDATSGLLVDGFNPRPDNAVDSLLKSTDGTRLSLAGCSTGSAVAPPATG